MNNTIEILEIPVLRLALGTWGLSGDWKDKEINENLIKRIINKSIQCGINLVDTAQVYGQGRMESIIGSMNLPKNIVISTKIPAREKPDNNNLKKYDYYYDRDYIFSRTKESLKRLGRIDILQLHNWHSSWNDNAPYFIRPLIELKNSGLIKAVGVSLPDKYDSTIIPLIKAGVDIIQVPYNSVQNWAERNVFIESRNNKIPILVRSMFGQGALLKNKEDLNKLKTEDIRKKYLSSDNLVEKAEDIIHRNKLLISNGILLIGMRKIEQIEENIKSFLK